jgi:hypothetical protein
MYGRIFLTIKERKLSNMKVLVLSKNNFEVREIRNELEDLQKIVGGYIEIPFLSRVFTDNGIDMIINEEGKFIEDCKPEIAIVDSNTKQVLDVVHGNCIFASHDEEGNATGLNEKQLSIVMRELKMDGSLMYPDGKEYVTRMLFI